MTASITFLGRRRDGDRQQVPVRSQQSQILVDCVLFQGLAPLRRRTWKTSTRW